MALHNRSAQHCRQSFAVEELEVVVAGEGNWGQNATSRREPRRVSGRFSKSSAAASEQRLEIVTSSWL